MSTLNEKRKIQKTGVCAACRCRIPHVRTNMRQIVIVSKEGCAKTIQYTFFFQRQNPPCKQSKNPSFTTSLGRHTHTFSKIVKRLNITLTLIDLREKSPPRDARRKFRGSQL